MSKITIMWLDDKTLIVTQLVSTECTLRKLLKQ